MQKPIHADNSNAADSSGSSGNQPSGIFMWLIATDRVYCDALVANSFGFEVSDVEAGLPIKSFLDRIHRDDLRHVGAAIRDAMETGQPYQAEYRICRPDGSTIQVAAFGYCFRSSDNQPSHYAGMVVPVETILPSDEHLLSLCLQAVGLATRLGRGDIASRLSEIIRDITFEDELDFLPRIAGTRH